MLGYLGENIHCESEFLVAVLCTKQKAQTLPAHCKLHSRHCNYSNYWHCKALLIFSRCNCQGCLFLKSFELLCLSVSADTDRSFFFLIEKNKSVIEVKLLQNSGVTVHAEKGLALSGVIDFNVSAHGVRYCSNTWTSLWQAIGTRDVQSLPCHQGSTQIVLRGIARAFQKSAPERETPCFLFSSLVCFLHCKKLQPFFCSLMVKVE